MSAPLVEIPYFRSTCSKVLDPYLQPFSFHPIRIGRAGIEFKTTSAYSNDEMALYFRYWPEDVPNYCLMIGLGFIRDGRSVADSEIGLWFAMPAEKQEVWHFKNEESLH